MNEAENNALNNIPDTERPSVPAGLENADNKDIVDFLFSNGNRLLTATGAEQELPKETQGLIAYFSGGEIIISRTHRYDGRVLAFLDLLKKRARPMRVPFYSDLGLVSSIYKAYENRLGGVTRSRQDYDNQMQKDFVDIIAKAAAQKVSDIHIEVADQTTIYFRIDGSMQPVLEYNSGWGESFVRAAFASSDMSFGSRYVVMRLLYDNPSEGIKTEQEFGEYEQKLLMRLRSFPTGLVIVAGPTSSGKSTTLVRNMSLMLKEHHYEINMITVEDPVEQKIFGAHQMPVVNTMNEEQREEKYTEALAAALRSDPDTLMVGEIRTLAAAQLTVRGALSGHNVWTTLHANSAMSALTRLLDLGIEAFKLKEETLMRGLISMRLFKKLCPHCRERLIDHPEAPEYNRVLDAFGELGLRQVYIRGAGCEECKGTGTLGRVKAGEIIITNSEFLRMALSGNTDGAYKYWLEEMDGRTLKEAATSLMLQGIIGVDELERWVGLLDRPGVY